jgi:hypothetical protein
VPLPYAQLVMLAITSSRGVGKWAVRTVRQHRELERMIKEALEVAICPELVPEDRTVQAVVTSVEDALDQQGATSDRPRVQRAGSALLRAVTRKRIWRTPATLIDDGPNFFQSIGVGVGRALETNYAFLALGNVICYGTPPTVSDVVSRFRLELERIVRQGHSTPLRRRLRMMLTEHEAAMAIVEREYWRFRVKVALSTLGPGAVVLGVTDAVALSTEQAAILGAITAGSAALIQGLASHGVGGVRLSTLKAIRSLLDAAAVDGPVPPDKERIEEIRQLAHAADTSDEPLLGNKLSALEHRLDEWRNEPGNPSLRGAAFRALAEVALVLRGSDSQTS